MVDFSKLLLPDTVVLSQRDWDTIFDTIYLS